MELTSVPKKSPQTSCLSGLFVCFSFFHNIQISLSLSFCLFVSLHHQVASSQLAVVGGRDPDGLSGRTRVFNFSEQVCTNDSKAEAIFSKITKIYIFMG